MCKRPMMSVSDDDSLTLLARLGLTDLLLCGAPHNSGYVKLGIMLSSRGFCLVFQGNRRP